MKVEPFARLREARPGVREEVEDKLTEKIISDRLECLRDSP